MKAAPFSYIQPITVAEAVGALAQHGDDGRIIAGGQSLGAMLNMRLVTPKALIDINRIDEINRIEMTGDTIRIGATVRQSDAIKDDRLRPLTLLKAALPYVGHFQTRNRGTICGSIAHADPSAEIPLALLVANGSVEMKSRRNSRIMSADDFFVSTLTTTRRSDEMIVAARWPKARPSSGCAFREFAIRSGDYAIVAAAAELDINPAGQLASIRLGLAGVGERPVLVDVTRFEGHTLSPEILAEIATQARRNIEPVSDLQATAEFRTHMAGVLASQVIDEAIGNAVARTRRHQNA